jgi:hypothetical protein
MPRKSSVPLSLKSESKPKPKPFLPPVPDTSTSQKPGFLSVVKDGLGFGFGSAIAHRVVGSVLGSSQYSQVQPQVQAQAQAQAQPQVQVQIPEKKNIEYEQCMQDYNNIDVCEIYLAK